VSDQKRKIGKIVFDRPALRTGRFFMWAGIGLVVGVLVGLLFWLGVHRGPGVDAIPKILWAPECWPYIIPSAFLGLLAGVIFGWAWKRPTEARIEMVDLPRERRRNSTSTAIARLDISGRSRF
jgi:hypothetical protein